MSQFHFTLPFTLDKRLLVWMMSIFWLWSCLNLELMILVDTFWSLEFVFDILKKSFPKPYDLWASPFQSLFIWLVNDSFSRMISLFVYQVTWFWFVCEVWMTSFITLRPHLDLITCFMLYLFHELIWIVIISSTLSWLNMICSTSICFSMN